MLPIPHYMYSATSPIKYMYSPGFHTGFFAGGGGRSNCKGSASMRKHGHTRVSVRAT